MRRIIALAVVAVLAGCVENPQASQVLSAFGAYAQGVSANRAPYQAPVTCTTSQFGYGQVKTVCQ